MNSPGEDSAGKIFVIGLPRTGTTSVCAALLDLGYRVAHTAYTKQAFALADVVADTPVFCDYPYLDKLFPGSQFIYLDRCPETWLPSIKSLLARIFPHLDPGAGRYNKTIKRCYRQVFAPLTAQSILSDSILLNRYLEHRQEVFRYFKSRKSNLLVLDLEHPESYCQLAEFLGREAGEGEFPRLNGAGQIAAWDKIRHPLKVSANAVGTERRRFFDYARQLDNAAGS